VSENRHGDPRYLEVARQVLADERKVLGVDAPDQLTVAATPFSAMSEAALHAELVRQQHLLHISDGPSDGEADRSRPPSSLEAAPGVPDE